MIRDILKYVSAIKFIMMILLLSVNLDAAVYYVNSISGNDSNTGLTPTEAWLSLTKVNNTIFMPGDSILFYSGGSWQGMLWPKGSGSSGNPITIDAYGEGNKPIFAGNGTVTNVIYLFNQEYWTIQNLEITNTLPGNTTKMLRGVMLLATDFGTVRNISLKDLYIHDVSGTLNAGDADNNLAKDNGGIFYQVSGSSVPTKFDNLIIEGCKIINVDRSGIANKSSWSTRTLTTNTNWFPNTNTIIRNNWIERTGANGLIIRESDSPLIEHNVFKQCGLKASGNAMFPFNCDDALFQYNEAYLTVYNSGDLDASGFDSDYRCKRTVFQYNYSHDNEGGFLVVTCQGGTTRFNDSTIVRYNISENDGRDIIHVSGQTTNTFIYNNTIYSDSKIPNNFIKHHYWSAWPNNTYYYNNIFVNKNGAPFTMGSSTNNLFDYNCFYGVHPASEPNDSHKIIDDPSFVQPGLADTGFSSTSGYKLLSSSPCIDSGILLSNHAQEDFWGNIVPSNGNPDRGAFEYSNTTGFILDANSPATAFYFSPNYPNPFNSKTGILYSLKDAGHLNLSIYNLLGEKIITLIDDYTLPGHYRTIWDGNDEEGKIVASGIYLCTAESMSGITTIKMLLMK